MRFQMDPTLNRTGVFVKTVTEKTLSPKSSHGSWSLRQPLPGDSTVARYSRVAVVETVMSIRNQQQRIIRRFVVGALVLTGLTVILAGVMGWL